MEPKEKYGFSFKNVAILIVHLLCFVFMLLVTVGYLFIPNLVISEIIEASILLVLLLIILWYVLIGYKTSGRMYNWIIYAYALLVAFNTAIHTLNSAETNVVFILGSFIVFALLLILANRPKNIKTGWILITAVFVIELILAFVIVILSGNMGVILGGDIMGTIANIHVFTRALLASTIALLYLARESKLLNN